MIRPYCFFLKENYKKTSETIGDIGGNKKASAFSKILSEKWKMLSDDQRKIYH